MNTHTTRRRLSRAATGLLLALLASPALGISDPAEMLPDPAAEARAEQIGRQLRCLVCQNESIEESGADLARDLRRIVRQRVATGEGETEVVAWMVQRYGNFVRLRPPLNAATALLWATPALALLGGLAGVWLARRRPTAAPAPLTEAERQRLSKLV